MYQMGRHTFPNKADALRFLAAARRNRTGGAPELLNMGYYGGDRNAAYCNYYWNYQHDMTMDEYMELARLQGRARSLFHHLREVAPGWQQVPGSTVMWADNSVEITEQATDGSGRTRTRQVVGPHGDLC
jgi:hypothetical protein